MKILKNISYLEDQITNYIKELSFYLGMILLIISSLLIFVVTILLLFETEQEPFAYYIQKTSTWLFYFFLTGIVFLVKEGLSKNKDG
jgi:hypothetical protein